MARNDRANFENHIDLFKNSDCTNCVFLGTTNDEVSKYDLYFCLQDGYPTVIARYGKRPENYLSGLLWASSGLSPALEIALFRAVRAGLIDLEEIDIQCGVESGNGKSGIYNR